MMIQQGQRVGFNFRILCQSLAEPAAQVLNSSHIMLGDPKKLEDLMKFLPQVEVVTFESEFIEVHQIRTALRRLSEKKTPANCSFFPSLECMEEIQDRLSQKNLLQKNRIPTAPFIHSQNLVDFQRFLKAHGKIVFKKRIGGYDGYGTFIIQSEKDLKKFLDQNEAQDFICEAFVPFDEELAFSLSRSSQGQISVFPFVKTHQKDHKCDHVFGPIKHAKSKALIQKVSALLKKIDYTGFITFELFNVNGNLYVNEVAPRVHNSAHYSLDAMNIDQFLAHLKAGLGMKFPPPEPLTKFFAMTNLIHLPENKLSYQNRLSGKLHWYGKTESRPGRKMGHINYVGKDPSVLKIALQERKKLYEK